MVNESVKKTAEKVNSEENTSEMDQQKDSHKGEEISEEDSIHVEKVESDAGSDIDETPSGESESSPPAEREGRYDEPAPDALTLISDLKEGGRYKGIINSIKDLRTSMDEKIQIRLRKISEQRLQEAESSLQGLEEESGRNFNELRGFLDQARTVMSQSDYDSVDTFLDSFIRTKESHEERVLLEKYRQEIEKLRADFAILEEAGIEPPGTERSIASIERGMSARQFDMVKEIMKETSRRINEAKTTTAKNVARIEFARVKNSFDRLKKTGLELVDEKKIFREAMLAIKGQQYLEGCVLLRRTNLMLEKADTGRLKEVLSSQLEEHRKFFSMMEDQQYFSTDYRNSIKEALDDLDGMIREGPISKVESEMKMFHKIMEDLKDKMDKFDRTKVLSVEVTALMEKTEDLDMDVTKESEMAEESRKLLKSDNTEDAHILLIKTKNSLLDRLEQHLREEAEKQLKEAKATISDNREVIEDTSKINLYLMNANTYFDQGKYEHTIKTVSKIIQLISGMKERKTTSATKTLFIDAENAIAENRERRIKVFESEALYYKAKFYFEKNDLEQATTYARSSLNCSLRERTELEKKKASIPLSQAQQFMKEAVVIGAELKTSSGIMESARKYFDNGKFSKAAEWANLAKAEIEGSINKRLPVIIQEKKLEIESLLAKAGEIDVETDLERQQLSTVEELHTGKKYREAIDILETIQSSLEKMITEGIRKINSEKIDKAWGSLETLQEKWGEEFTDLGEPLELARAALQEGRYDVLDAHLEEFSRTRERHNNVRLSELYTRKVADMAPDLETLKSLGIDISGADELVASVSDRISSFDFEDTERYLSKLVEFIEHARTVKAKKRAGEYFKKTKEIFLEMKSESIPMEGAKEHIKEALEHINVKDYIKAIERTLDAEKALNEARDRYYKSATIVLLGEVAELEREGEDLGLDLSDIMGMTWEVQNAMEQGRFREARDLTIVCSNELKKSIENRLSSMMEDRLAIILPALEEAKEIGTDLSEEDDALTQIMELKEKKQYRAAMDRIDAMGHTVDQKKNARMRQLNSQKIYIAVNALLTLQEETGWELNDLQGSLDLAQESLERNDYDGVDSHLNEYFLLKTKAKNRFLTEKYTKDLEGLRNIVPTLRNIGIDIDNSDELIVAIEEDISEKGFELVAKNIGELSALIKEARSVRARKLANKNFNDAKGLFIKLKHTGAGFKKEKVDFKKAVELTKSRDFVGACGLVLDIIERLKEANESYVLGKLYKQVDEAEAFYQRLDAHEYFPIETKTDIRTSLNGLISLLGEKKLGPAGEEMKLLLDRTMSLESTMNDFNETTNLISELGELVEAAKKINLETEGEEESLTKAMELKETDSFNEATSLLKEAIDTLGGKVEQRYAELAKDSIEQAEKDLEDSSDIFKDPDAMMQRLSDAKALYDRKEYEHAAEISRGLNHIIAETREQQTIKELDGLIKEVRILIDDNEKLGVEIFQSDALYYKARYHFERKEFDQSKDYCDKAHANAMQSKAEFQKRGASEGFNEVRDSLKRSIELELDVSGPEERLKTVIQLLEDKKYEGAMEIINEVRDELEEQQFKHQKAALSSQMRDFREFIKNLQALFYIPDENVSRADLAYEVMEDLLAQDDLGKLEAKINLFRDEMSKLERMKEHHDEAEQLMEAIEQHRAHAKEFELDIRKEDGWLEDAKVMMREKNFREASQLLKGTMNSLGNKIEIIRMKNAQGLLETAVRMVEENQDIIEELSSLEESFSAATRFIEKKQYLEATDTLTELIRLVEDAKEQKRSEDIGKLQDEIGELMVENEGLGLDISPYKDRLEQARASLERKNYGLAEKYTREIWESVLDSQREFYAMRCTSQLEDVREGIRELDELGLETSIMEEELENVLLLQEESEFRKAVDQSTNIIDSVMETKKLHFSDQVSASLNDLDEMMERGQELGLDVAYVEDEIARCTAFSEVGDYSDALELAESTRSGLSELIDQRLDERIQRKIDDLTEAIENARSQGIDISAESEALGAAEAMKKEARFEDAAGIILSNKVSVDNKINAYLIRTSMVKVNDIERELVSFQEETGKEYPDMGSFVEMAKKSIENMDYEALDSFISEFEKLKEGHTKDYWGVWYEEQVELLKGEMQDIMRTTLDVSLLAKQLDLLNDRVFRSDFDGAKEALAEVKSATKEIKTVQLRGMAKDIISETKTVFDSLNETEVDLEREKELFSRVWDSFKSRDFVDAVVLGSEVKELIQDAHDLHFKEQVLSILEDITVIIGENEDLMLDTLKVRETTDDLELRLNERDVNSSLDLAQSAREEIKDMIEGVLTQNVETALNSFREMMEEAAPYELDLRDENETLNLIEENKNEKQYREALKVLEKNSAALADKIIAGRVQKHSRMIEEARNALASLEEETGEEYRGLRTMLDEAVRALEKNEFDEIKDQLEEFYESKDKQYERALSEKYSKHMSEDELEIVRIRELGIDCTIGEELLTSAREHLYQNEFDTVLELRQTIEEFIKDAKTVQAKTLAKELLHKGKSVIDKLKGFGSKVTGETKVLKEAINHIKEEDFLKACELALEANKMLETAYEEHLLKDITSQLAAFREFYEEVEKNKHFTSDYKQKLRAMIETIEFGLHQNRLKDAEEGVEAFKAAISETRARMENFRKSESHLEINDELFGTALTLGLNVALERTILKEVERLNVTGRLDDALPLLMEANESLENKIDLMRMEEANVLFEKVISHVEENEEAIKEISGLDNLITSAKGHLSEKKYDSFTEVSERIIRLVIEAKEKRQVDEIQPIISECENIIEENREKGINVFSSEGLLNKARLFLERKEYEQAEEHSESALEQARTDRRGFEKKNASSALAAAWNLISKSLEMGVEISEIETMMATAQALFKEKKFVEAAKVAEDAKGVVVDGWEKYYLENATRLKNQISEMTEEGRELELDMTPIDEMMDKLDTLLTETKFKDAQEAAKETKDILEEMISSKLSEILQTRVLEFSRTLEEASEKEINIEEENAALEAITNMEKGGKYREAVSTIKDIQVSLDSRLSEYRKKVHLTKIEGAEEELVDLERETGGHYKELHSYLASAKGALEGEDFDTENEYLVKFHKYKTECSNRFYTKKCTEELAEHTSKKDIIKEAGIDVEDIEGILSTVEASVSEEDFESAILSLDVARELLVEAETIRGRELASGLWAELGEKSAELKGWGIDITTVTKELENIQSLLDKEDYVAVCKSAKGVWESLEKLRQTHFTEKITKLKSELDSSMERGGELELDLSEIGGKASSAQFHFESERFEEAYESFSNAISALNDLINGELSRRIQTLRSSINTAMDEIKELGIDVGSELEILSAIGEMESAGKLEDVLDILDDVKRTLADKKDGSLRELNLGKIREAWDDLEALRDETGEELEELTPLLDRATTAVDERNYEEVDIALEDFHAFTRTYQEQYSRRKYGEELVELKEDIDELTGFGIDMSSAETIFINTKDELESADLDEVVESISKINELLEYARTEEVEKKAKEYFVITKKIFTQVKETGMDIVAEKGAFRKALDAIKQQEYMAAIKFTLDAKELLIRAQKRYLVETSSASVREMQLMVDESRKMGMDISSVEVMMSDMHNCLKREDFKGVEELVEKGKGIISVAREKHYVEMATASSDELERLFDEANSLDLDISGEKKIPERVRELLKAGEAREAAEVAGKALDGLQDLVNAKLSWMLGRRLDSVQKLMERGEDHNLDMTREAEAMSVMEGLKEMGKYRDAIGALKAIQASLRGKIEEVRGPAVETPTPPEAVQRPKGVAALEIEKNSLTQEIEGLKQEKVDLEQQKAAIQNRKAELKALIAQQGGGV